MGELILNKELDGIEIKFESKPLQATIDGLKQLGFRWRSKKKVWYAKNTPERLETARIIADSEEYAEQIRKEEPKGEKQKAEKKNAFGVKIGDIFSASWGYEQTNNNFFQVIALVGEKSVRVREVNPPIISRDPVSRMSEDRVYKITNEILPPASRSGFIKDQENGDLKRLKPGYFQDEKKAMENCYFNLSSFADAHKCIEGEIKIYESWYY